MLEWGLNLGYFTRLQEVLFCENVEEKFEKFEKFYDDFRANLLDFEEEFTPCELTAPSYAKFCKIVSMKDIKNKNQQISDHKNSQISHDKTAIFLHSIAHIEYCAVDIALDAAYRFSAMPRQFYADWLEVAQDEIRHFKMICTVLNARGVEYGDFAVHDGLFIALQKTATNLVERMAVLPRFMEANGLDANNFLIEKNATNVEFSDILPLLQIIMKEEISHVKKGDFWFKFACKISGRDPRDFVKIVQNHYPRAFITKRKLNIQARIEAGFSADELRMIENLQN